VLWPLARSFGLGTRTGAAVALLLAQSGEFGLVLFAYTHQLNLIDTGLFQQLLLVVVLSMLVTPVISQLAQRLATIPVDQKEASQEPPAPEPVVIAGFGRVGRTLLLISTPRSCCGNAQTDIEFSMATCGAPKSYVLPALPMRSS